MAENLREILQKMETEYNDKINLLKALAIMIVVSGHLEFSLIPMFPPYSFQVVLFFFITGMLYKNKSNLVPHSSAGSSPPSKCSPFQVITQKINIKPG